MLLLYEVGRRIGIVRLARDPGGVTNGSGPVEAAIFGLLGLLLAFTFSGAASRFEERRHLVAEETNAIGTAYLRVDLLPPDAQPALRQLFSRYVDARLKTFHSLADVAATQANLSATDALQHQIWSRALPASQQPGAAPDAQKLLLPALNQMFDITTTRTMATRNHPPTIIFYLLAGLSLLSALLIGYVILDLEYPRLGLIRVDAADQVLMDLRKSMGQ